MIRKHAPRNTADLALLISDQVTAMLAYWDKDLICRFANNAYLDWFNKTKAEMIDKIRIDELLGPLYEKNLPYIKAVLLGEKQLFEREIPIPGGSGVRHSLATYIPDINNCEVLGFFVHVADVTYLKDLEKTVANAKRDILRNIIETEEAEKRSLVEILRENISQMLAACKIEIETERIKRPADHLNENIDLLISGIIREINKLCQELIPTEIELLGITDTIRLYLDGMAQQQHKKISFICEDATIENIKLTDKYSVFRIIQNLIKLVFDCSEAQKTEISLKYTESQVYIKFRIDADIVLDKSLREYNSFISRVEYHSGNMSEFHTGSESIFDIEFSASGKQAGT